LLRERKYKKTSERYAKNPELHSEQLERQRKWRKEQYADPEYRESENKRHRKRYADNPEIRIKKVAHLKELRNTDENYRKEYNRKHREYVKEKYHNDFDFYENIRGYFQRRRAVKRGNGGSFSEAEWLTLCGLAKDRCLSCGKQEKLTVDHVIPVTSQGNSDIQNIQPLCHSCNSKKGTAIMDFRTDEIYEWLGL